MPNWITEKYFSQEDFSQRADDILPQVTKETGFIIQQELFRGTIYDEKKVGSMVYAGKWQGKQAVLKLQGLKPDIDEFEMITNFMEQNKSMRIRVPKTYIFQRWEKTLAYGFSISEYVGDKKIYTRPFATKKDMDRFADFFQEYRKKAISQPWFESDVPDSLTLTKKRVEHWKNISEDKKRLDKDEYVPYYNKYISIINEQLPSVPLIFCHGHMTPQDVLIAPDGYYVLLSNLFWSYRPQWYELAFNVWSCLVNIRDTLYTFNQAKEYINEWLKSYRAIPAVQEDNDFERKINVAFLERMIGAILVDIGARSIFDDPKNKQYYNHLLKLHQGLFEHFVKLL